MANEKKKRSIKEWFEQKWDEKAKKDNMKLLKLSLNTAKGLYDQAVQNCKKGSRADLEEALLALTTANKTFEESMQYSNE